MLMDALSGSKPRKAIDVMLTRAIPANMSIKSVIHLGLMQALPQERKQVQVLVMPQPTKARMMMVQVACLRMPGSRRTLRKYPLVILWKIILSRPWKP